MLIKKPKPKIMNVMEQIFSGHIEEQKKDTSGFYKS